MRVITHSNVDFDCLLSVYLIQKHFSNQEMQVVFNSKAKEKDFALECGDIFVDLSPYATGNDIQVYDHHQKNSQYQSASHNIFVNLLNKNPIYQKLVEEANNEDNLLDLKYNGVNIRFYMNYLKETLKDDYKVYEEMKKLFDYVVAFEEKKLNASRKFNEIGRIEEIKGKKIAIVVGELDSYMSGWIYDEMGVNFIIYKDGYNMGILRNVNETFDLNIVKNKMQFENKDKWFCHPQGFILCWGSKKFPAKEDSGVGVEDLFQLLVSCL